MKKITLLILILCSLQAAKAQTYIKGNALYWLAGVTNASVETRLSDHWTFNADLVYSPWQSIKGKPYLVGQFIPEARYYIKEANDGFYIAGYASVQAFKITKWNYGRDRYQVGGSLSFGVSLGYEMPIADRWLMDFYAGFGWVWSRYKGYLRPSGDMYIDWNRSGEWIPYKIGVGFAYRL